MRSVPVVRINVVLAPKSCNFPEVAVVVEHFFPVSNFRDTSTRGTEMASLCLLCAWDLYTCSVVKPLMRPLLSYSGFRRNMKSHYPESMNDICSPSPSWSRHPSRSCCEKDVLLRVRIRAQKRRWPFLAQAEGRWNFPVSWPPFIPLS